MTPISEIKAKRDEIYGEALRSLPALEGSEKQVAWANTIREKQLEHLTRCIVIERLTDRTGTNAERVAYFARRREVLEARLVEALAVTSAKWWCDRNRTDLTV